MTPQAATDNPAHWPDPDQLGVAETLTGEARLDRERLRAIAEIGIFDLFDEGDAHGPSQLLYLETLRQLASFAPTLARLVAACHDLRLIRPTAAGPCWGAIAVPEQLECADLGGGHWLLSGTLTLDLPPQWLDSVLVPCGDGRFLCLHQPLATCDLEVLDQPGQITRYRLRLSRRSVSPLDQRRGSASHLRIKAALDLGAQLLGCLDAAHNLAESFAAERVLFRKRLADNGFIAGRHQAMRAESARLWSALLDLAGRARGGAIADDEQRLLGHFGRRALDQVAEALQLCGGTGLMDEFGMPACYRRVLHLLETYRPPLDDSEGDREIARNTLTAMTAYGAFLQREDSAAASAWSRLHELATLEVQP